VSNTLPRPTVCCSPRVDAVHAAFPADILAEQQHLGPPGEFVAQRLVDGLRDGERHADGGGRLGGRHLRCHGVRVARRERPGDLGPGEQRRGRERLLGGLGDLGADLRELVREILCGRKPQAHDGARGAEQRIALLVRGDLLRRAVRRLHVRAGVPVEAHRRDVQEGGRTLAAHVVCGRRRGVEDGDRVRAVGREVLEPRTRAVCPRDPAGSACAR
jgi:hypothetical protein